MRSLQREPGLLLALLAVILLVTVFILYPQMRVILTPGTGYVDFFTGGSWVRATLNSMQVMALSTTTAVLLVFVFAVELVYTSMRCTSVFLLVIVIPLLSPLFCVT